MTLRIMAAAASLALAVAVPAEAKVYPLYLYGTIASGFDNTGYFLAGGGNLAGKGFKAAFFTDDATGAVEQDDGQRSTIFGADAHNPTTAMLTINGVTVTFGQRVEPIADGFSDEHFGETTQQLGANESFRRLSESWLYDDRDWSWTFFHLLAGGGGQNFLGNHDWRSLTTAEAMAAATKTGAFDIAHFDNFQGYVPLAHGTFDIVSVGIPEPAAWVLLVGGFGLLGGMLRRRRTAVAEG